MGVDFFKVQENIFILEFKRVYHVKMGPLIVLMVAIPLLLNGYSIERKSRDINIQSLETARKGWNNLEQVVESFEDALHIDFQDLHLSTENTFTWVATGNNLTA